MQKRKLIVLPLLLGLSLSSTAYTMDLGEMEVKSAPGEPLDADIPLDMEDSGLPTYVGLASETEFSDAVIAVNPELTSLRFSMEKEGDNTSIRVTTKKPLDGEVVHFLLAVEAPHGRIVREYVVLEEDDIYATHAQPTIVTAINATESLPELPLPIIALTSKEEFEEEYQESVKAKAAEERKERAEQEEREEAEEREEREERREAEEREEREEREEAKERGEREEFEEEREEEEVSLLVAERVAHKAPAAVYQQHHYRVKEGDNLWHIAKRLQAKMPNTNFYQLLAALYELNPNAFINGNVNLIRQGATLTIPTAAVLAELNVAEAKEAVRAQMATYSNKQAIPSAAAEEAPTETVAAAANVAAKPAELKILAPETAAETKEDIAALTDEQINENLALINEELAQVHRYNEGLLTRIEALQTQIATLQELLSVRESAQQGLSENASKENAAPAETTTPEIAAISPETSATPAAPASTETPLENTTEAVTETLTPIPAAEQPAAVEEKPGLELTNKNLAQEEQKVSQYQWLNYLYLGLGILLVLLVLYVLKRRRTKKLNEEELEQEREHNINPEVLSGETESTPAEEEENKVDAKLELAKAYYDLGDSDGAIALLQEILWEGNTEQRQAAQEWLDKIDAEKKGQA